MATVTGCATFNAQGDAECLRKAMKGLGTDEASVIHIIGTRSNAQRQQIKTQYKTLFGKDLADDLKSELSGKFEDVILGLLMPSVDYDAYHLHKAMEGLGTDESALVEILCSRTNQEIAAIKNAFKRLYKKDLEKCVKSEVSGSLERLFVSLLQGARGECDALDGQRAAEDAQSLYKAGEGKLGTDESRFNAIFASRSFPQLRMTFEEYKKISKKTLEQAVKSEMSGDVEKAMVAIIRCAQDPAVYFAEQLYLSMKGLGTDDKKLIRIMVSRSEIDLVQIKLAFQSMYAKSLADFINGDCSGDYKKLLLVICGN